MKNILVLCALVALGGCDKEKKMQQTDGDPLLAYVCDVAYEGSFYDLHTCTNRLAHDLFYAKQAIEQLQQIEQRNQDAKRTDPCSGRGGEVAVYTAEDGTLRLAATYFRDQDGGVYMYASGGKRIPLEGAARLCRDNVIQSLLAQTHAKIEPAKSGSLQWKGKP